MESFLAILAGINAALRLAAYAEPVIKATKAWIDSLKGMTAEQQNALKQRIDADAALALAGIPPNAGWTVEPDPTATVPMPPASTVSPAPPAQPPT